MRIYCILHIIESSLGCNLLHKNKKYIDLPLEYGLYKEEESLINLECFSDPKRSMKHIQKIINRIHQINEFFSHFTNFKNESLSL